MRGKRPTDNLLSYGNSVLLMHMQSRGGLGAELQPAIAVKDRVVQEFAAYVREGDELATPREFCRVLFLELQTVSKPLPDLVRKFAEAEGGDIPFARKFAEGIDANQAFEFERDKPT